jgi:hypothetical protein
MPTSWALWTPWSNSLAVTTETKISSSSAGQSTSEVDDPAFVVDEDGGIDQEAHESLSGALLSSARAAERSCEKLSSSSAVR